MKLNIHILAEKSEKSKQDVLDSYIQLYLGHICDFQTPPVGFVTKSARQKCEMCEQNCWTEGKVSDLEKCSSSHSLAKKTN